MLRNRVRFRDAEHQEAAFSVFSQNVLTIGQFNKDQAALAAETQEPTAKLSSSGPFAAMTLEDFKKIFVTYRPQKKPAPTVQVNKKNAAPKKAAPKKAVRKPSRANKAPKAPRKASRKVKRNIVDVEEELQKKDKKEKKKDKNKKDVPTIELKPFPPNPPQIQIKPFPQQPIPPPPIDLKPFPGNPDPVLKPFPTTTNRNPGPRPSGAVPSDLLDKDAVDWVRDGRLSPVQNQGQCGSCAFFALVAVLESHLAIQSNSRSVPEKLSEQMLVDCYMTKEGQKGAGCDNGGDPQVGLNWVNKYGLATAAQYPYKGKGDKCAMKGLPAPRFSSVWRPRGAGQQFNDNFIMEFVRDNGPVTAAVYAGSKVWQHYKNGVIRSQDCQGTRDHIVAIVGYGSLNGFPVWIIRNSWGPSWGIGGYAFLERNTAGQGGACSIAEYNVAPVFN